MNLEHIDNSFFRLTNAQARKLSIDGKLPSSGFEKRADRAQLEKVRLMFRCSCHHQLKPCAMKAHEAASAWITRTVIHSKVTFALRLYFRPNFGH